MSRYERYEPRRANTKDSWITIDWGKRAPPSALHGILDQIAGKIIRDPKLVEQGKREWHKAAAIRRERRRRAARGEKVSSSKSGSGSGSGSGHSRSQSTRISSTRRKTNANTGFFAGLFGASNKKKRQSGVKRALTRPGQQRTTSSGRRPTTTRHESSRRDRR